MTLYPELPAPVPPVDPENVGFWAATQQDRLLLPRCRACGLTFWYPRPFCPDCGGDSIELVPSAGRGTIYSYTVQRRLTGAYRELESNVLAFVELTEGPRLLTNIVECDGSELTIGQPVEVVFHATGQGQSLYRFRPVAGPGRAT